MALIRPKRNDIFLYMRMLYLRTEKSVVNELKRQQASGLVDYGTYAALMRVQQTLQEMQDESFTYVPEMVNKVFRDANARAGYEAAEALSVAQTAIVEQLTGNLLGCITEAAETAYKTSESVLQLGRLHPDVFRNPVILSSALAEAEGRGMSPAVTRALHSLQNDNITSFVDKSGREWGLTEYCTMATRTVRTQATVAANLTSDDWDLWKITPNGSTCALCAAYEGRVYSKSGTNPDYPPLSAAFGKIDPAGGNDLSNTYLNIHPNCLHSLVRYTTAGRTDEEIQKDKDFSSFEKRPADVDYRTKKQIEEYREKERKRAEFLATRRQWNDYRERLGKDIPSLETFEKHKKLNDDKYKAWEAAYRKKGAELRKKIKENPPVIPPNPAPKPIQPKPVQPKPVQPAPAPKPATPPAPAPKPVQPAKKPVVQPAPAQPAPQTMPPPPPVPSAPPKQVTTVKEAETALIKDLGFQGIGDGFMRLPGETIVENTNQLLRLEQKFGIIHRNNVRIVAENDKPGTFAFTRTWVTRRNDQELSLCPRHYMDRNEFLQKAKAKIRVVNGKLGWSMPAEESFAPIYTVTHEYGHMIQNHWMYWEMKKLKLPEIVPGMSKLEQDRIRRLYRDAAQKLQRQAREEIWAKVEKKNPWLTDDEIKEMLSGYSKTADAEFFAETFANSQGGKPNDFGKAMLEWLKEKGLMQ